MASKKEIEREKRQLVNRLDGLRAALGPDRQSFLRKLHPLGRFRTVLARHPLRVFGAACLGSAIITRLFRRRTKPQRERTKKKPLAGALSAVVIAGLRPALKHGVAYMVKQQLSSRTKTQSPDSLLGP